MLHGFRPSKPASERESRCERLENPSYHLRATTAVDHIAGHTACLCNGARCCSSSRQCLRHEREGGTECLTMTCRQRHNIIQRNLLALKSLHIVAAVLLKAALSVSFPDGCDSTGATAILSTTYVQGNFQETSGAVLIQCG